MMPPNGQPQPEYVLGPDGKTLGFYDNNGAFIPSNQSTATGQPVISNPYMQGATSEMSNHIAHAGNNMFNGPIAQQAMGMYNSYNNPIQAPVVMPTTAVAPPSGDLATIQGIQQQLASANVTQPAIAPATGMSNQQKGNLLGLAAGGVSALGSTIAPDQYDQRIGMSKPNPIKSFSDLQMTQMGSAFGPAGTAVGFGLDLVKNTMGYAKQKAQYKAGTNKANFYDWRDDSQNAMQPDYTGLARNGMEVDGIPVEIERNERVYMPQDDGSYQMVAETSPNDPSHEEGGVKTKLPEGSLVFPKQYYDELDEAMRHGGSTGNWGKMDKVRDKMKVNANKAYEAGNPYSSGGKMKHGGDITPEEARFSVIVDKYKTSGWDSLTSDEQSFYRSNYDKAAKVSTVVDKKEGESYDVYNMGDLPEATVTAPHMTVADKVRKGTGGFAKGIAATALFAQEVMDTPLALLSQIKPISTKRANFYDSLPSPERAMQKAGIETGNTQPQQDGLAKILGVEDVPYVGDIVDLVGLGGISSKSLMKSMPRYAIGKGNNVTKVGMFDMINPYIK